MPTTTITDVRTVGVTVTNQDDAIDFYVGTLGFDKVLDAPISPTMRWVEVAPSGASTTIALVAGDGAPAAGAETGIRFTAAQAPTRNRA